MRKREAVLFVILSLLAVSVLDWEIYQEREITDKAISQRDAIVLRMIHIQGDIGRLQARYQRLQGLCNGELRPDMASRQVLDVIPAFKCRADGRTVNCVALNTSGHSFKWAAVTEKEPSYFAYGNRDRPRFIFRISEKELTVIQLFMDDGETTLIAYAKWDGRKTWFSEKRGDFESS